MESEIREILGDFLRTTDFKSAIKSIKELKLASNGVSADVGIRQVELRVCEELLESMARCYPEEHINVVKDYMSDGC